MILLIHVISKDYYNDQNNKTYKSRNKSSV